MDTDARAANRDRYGKHHAICNDDTGDANHDCPHRATSYNACTAHARNVARTITRRSAD
jgi:hypothetical protein